MSSPSFHTITTKWPLLVLALLLLLTSCVAAVPTNWFEGAKIRGTILASIIVPDNYPTIQAAINAASDGDTVFVRNGTYYENVVVNKTLTLIGEHVVSTVIDGSHKGDVIQIEANNVSVYDFTLQDASAGWCGAIVESGFSDIVIANNTMIDNHCGVAARAGSLNVTISNNSIFNRQPSYADGIRLFSTGNLVIGNTITNESSGIGVDASGNRIEGNLIANNSIGIGNSPGSVFFHNNLVNNGQQATAGGYNSWDMGYPSGGNYWSDYKGTDLFSGPHQNETGSDNIGDLPYVIDANNVDNYPLMKPYVPFENQTIYIRADGSVDPSGAPVLRQGDLYTLTSNITSNAEGIVIERDNMTLDGADYTLQGMNLETSRGMELTGRSTVTIKNMKITAFDYGIYLASSDNNSLSGNNITADNFSWFGVYLGSSSMNSVNGNNITNKGYGIMFDSSSNNSVGGNNITNNNDGIYLHSSSNNSVSGNNMTNNEEGMWLDSSSNNNSLSGNNITASNGGNGILLSYSSDNILRGNNMGGNWAGIALDSSSNNTIYYNNFINNTNQVYSSNSTDAWDNGYPPGGNYWSDYNGTDVSRGMYQNETGSDGIGDSPYTIDANNGDNYPLMKPYPWAAHDVGVTSVATSKNFVGQGYDVSINMMLFNYGSDTEGVNVTVYANQTIIGGIFNVEIKSRNFTILPFTWNNIGFAKSNYTISAYAEPVQGEIDTADNVLAGGFVKVTIVGDVNGDGKVNLIDVFSVALAYGSYPGHPMWNSNYDINNDGKINLIDYFIVALNFGKTDP